jgi:hypothetical protein
VRPRRLLLALALLVAAPSSADEYSVAEDKSVWLRALLDVRIVRPGSAPSWMDRGPSVTRYGGVVGGNGQFERVTRFAISQFALEPGGWLPGDVELHAQANWEGNIDDQGEVSPDYDAPRLVEGWARRAFGDTRDGWSVLAGVSNPPNSMEHTGPAWTPRYTLTPSALDTWFWEEGRVLGVQGDWWTTTANETELNAFGGFGWGPDQQGILLARRGWVMSDWLAGMNSTMPLPPGGTTNEFEERDGRPAVYVGGNVRDPWKIGELHAGYFDNLGDLSVKGVWETRYATVGVSAAPLPGLDLMFQYLIGKTNNRSGPFDNTIQAFYPLASYRWRGHRISVRYDNFRVQDDRHAAPFNRERGWAVTVAYLFEFWLRHRIGFEYIIPDSHRPDRAAPDPSDDGWQLSYRFRY